MTAHDQIRAMLDQLMGTARNGEDDKPKIRFDDPRICKSFLIGCCPHEVLAATRMDIGECSKIHNLALRADFEQASKDKDFFFDLEAMEQLSVFVADADRKTEQARKRLLETQETLSDEVQGKADKIHQLGEKIGETLAKAEQLGAEGLVDESMKMMEEIDQLRKEKGQVEAEYRSLIPAATYQQQKLRVCDVCCAYLGIHDNDRRLADHFGGKLHLGFIKIRDTLKEFQASAEDRRRQRREKLRLQRIEEEEKARRGSGRERGGGGGGERRRSRSRSRDRQRRRRSRSKERKRKSRSRSRSRERRRGSGTHKDKERKKRSRSRSRDKDKDKERKSRHSDLKEHKSDKSSSSPPPPTQEEGGKSSISEEEPGEV